MNGFDVALIAVVAVSTLFAFWRGVVRELIAIAAWVVGFVAAIEFAGTLAGWFTGLDASPAVKHVLAFALILIVALVAGAVIARMMSSVIKAVGLGFVDRTLGAVFGLARGIAVMVIFALVAGVTTLPKQDWWQNSTFGQPLAETALAMRPYLPRAWAARLDFNAAGTVSAGSGNRTACGPPGVHWSCVES
jgi:membrane protein required for colicin V production